MPENNISRVYQFLAKFGTDSNGNAGWVEKADCKKKDGIITKAEFRQFINENWSGEQSLGNDLINAFWAKFDTDKSSKIIGSKLSNKNALDQKEQDTVLEAIKAYEAVDNTVKNLSTNVVKNVSKWKNSIREDLLEKVEKEFLRDKNISAKGIDAYIAEILPDIQNKETADYCAQEYIAESMDYAIKNHGYKYGDDKTLESIINNYLESLKNNEVNEEKIKETVRNIIDAYKATAEKGATEEQKALLAQFGYTIDQETNLNDLQMAVLKSKISTNFKDISTESDYKENQTIYDDALSEFINNKLESAKFGDFNTILELQYSDFTASDEFKNAKNIISVQNFLSSTELTAVLTKKFGEVVSDTIIKNGAYIKSVSDIKNTVLEKVKNGEFLTNGELDMTLVQTFFIRRNRKTLVRII